MGSTNFHYNRCLSNFARFMASNYDNNDRLANHFSQECEDSNEELERYILKKMLETDKAIFFYDAGRCSQWVLDFYSDSIGEFNDCIDGIMQFEYFIGLPDCDEEEEE